MKKYSFLLFALLAFQACQTAPNPKPIFFDTIFGIGNAIVGVFNDILNGFILGISEIINAAGAIIKAVTSTIQQAAKEIRNNLTSLRNSAILTFNSGIQQAVQTVQNWYDQYVAPVIAEGQEALTNFENSLDDLNSNVNSIITNTINDYLNKTQTAIDNGKKLNENAKQCFDDLETERQAAVDNYLNTVKQMCVEPLKDSATAVADKVDSVVQEKVECLNTKVTGLQNCMNKIIKQLSCFTAVINDIPAKLTATGQDLLEFAANQTAIAIANTNNCIDERDAVIQQSLESIEAKVDDCVNELNAAEGA